MKQIKAYWKNLGLWLILWSVLVVTGCSLNADEVRPDRSFDFERPLGEEEYELTFGNSSYFNASEGKALADELMTTQQYEGVNLYPTVDWLALDDLEQRSVAYRLNGFKFIAPFFKAYEETNDSHYVSFALQQMLSWIETHPEPFEGSTWGWHDDATARRVFYFTMALVLWEDLMDQKTHQILTDSLKMQVDLLTTDEFYTFNHNHGMFQDQALVLYALACEEGATQQALLSLAKTRSGQYFETSVASDGVHKEHSPSYHYGIARNIDWFALAYQSASPHFSSQLHRLSEKMATYATHLTMPNQETPSIGDSARQIRRYQAWMDGNDGYRYALTGGKEGTKPKKTSMVFQEGGYGIMRSSWEDSAETGTWMMLSAATHSQVHKHNDDLNVLLYHKGDLLVEAGNRNYDYHHPLTQYAYGSYAHNVMLVNDQPFKTGAALAIVDEQAKETGIVAADFNGKLDQIQGVQRRYSGVEQKRTLTYDRTQSHVIIRDDVQTTDEETSLRFLYHLAEDIQIKKQPQGWLLSREDIPVALMTVSGTSEVVLSEIYGASENDSPYQGLIFNGSTEAKEGYVLMVESVVPNGTHTFEVEFVLF